MCIDDLKYYTFQLFCVDMTMTDQCVCLSASQHDDFRKQQADKVAGGSDIYFLKQTAVNSCGTIALLHAVANNQNKLTFGK